MKVLQVTGMYSTKYGGMEKFFIELLDQGVELSVVYNNTPQPETYRNELERRHAGIYTVHGNILQRCWQTYRIIRRERPEIVHYHFGFTVYVLYLPVRLFLPHTKQLLTQHCEYLYENPLMRLATKLCYRSLDLVTSVSEGVRKRLVSKIGDSPKFTVSYLGVGKKEIRNKNMKADLNIPAECLVLTSIGFDIHVKGFDVLAQAVCLLKGRNDLPDFRIIIIGLNESEDEKFRAITEVWNVSDRFLSVGIRNDIDDFLSMTDVYLQPSRSEAISLSIMEALMYGLPVIGSDVGGISEACIPGYNGILTPQGDPDELALAILKLITDSGLRTRFGDNSRIHAANFRLDANAGRLIATYRNLLKRP